MNEHLMHHNLNSIMTVARRQRHSSTLRTIASKYSKITSVWLVVSLVCFLLLVLFGYYPLQRLQSATRTYDDNLYFSPLDLPNELIHSLDAILVLGGGRPKSIDHPPVFVERRCDDAISVFRRRVQGGHKDFLPILCLSAGTAHLPQLLSADGLPIWESTACASYILSKNKNATAPYMIPQKSVFVETSSYDTIGNAYFARTSHTEFNGWKKLLIITNEFHMARTRKIFDWVFSVPTNIKPISPYDLYYLESPNIGMASEVVKARKEREASSSKSVDNLSKKYFTLQGIYEFLTQEHSLYSAKDLIHRGHATTAEIDEGSIENAVKRSYGAN